MDFRGILSALVEADVDFVVVGGVGAVLEGVPMTTNDLDIVPSRGPANLERMAAVLRALDAHYRELLPERVQPAKADLSSGLHHLLQTRLGPLDILGTVQGGLDYEDLVLRSKRISLAPTLEVRVLDLRGLIELKEALGREKDRAQLALMRTTLEARETDDRT